LARRGIDVRHPSPWPRRITTRRRLPYNAALYKVADFAAAQNFWFPIDVHSIGRDLFQLK
jgi:hypothetical protein